MSQPFSSFQEILCKNTKPTAHPSVDVLRTMCHRSCVTVIFQDKFVGNAMSPDIYPTVDRSFAGSAELIKFDHVEK